MIKLFLSVIFICFLHLALFSQGNSKESPKVFLIGIDGMSPAGLMAAHTPNIDELRKNGAYTYKARSIRPTSSSSNWTSMVSGAGPAQHGVTSNAWQRDNFEIHPSAVGAEDIFPSIFSLIHLQSTSISSAAIYHWKGLGRLIEESVIDHVFHGETELITVQKTMEILRDEKPDFTFMALDHVDGAGHRHGHMAEGYLASITYTDSLIGELIQVTKDAGTFDNTVFIIISDHGFKEHGHGGDSPDELLIPFIINGPGIKKEAMITEPVYIFDAGATIASLLGLKIPRAWIGKPVDCAFEGIECEKTDMGVLNVDPPVFIPGGHGFFRPGGLMIESEAFLKFESGSDNIKIHYTLDGSTPNAMSPVYTTPVKIKKSCVVRSVAIDPSGQQSIPATAYYRVIKSNAKPAVSWKYFEVDELEKLPNFSLLKPIKTGTKYEFSLDTSMLVRKQEFAIQMESRLVVPADGEYTFHLRSKDGSKLYLDGDLLVDLDGRHGMIEEKNKVKLVKGTYPIRVDYFLRKGAGALEVFWESEQMKKSLLFPDYLK